MDADLPGVSFIMPVFDGGSWLGPALDAILAQRDGRPFEVIVVDDGSTDGSRALLRRYEEEGSLRVVETRRVGPSAAMNRALELARHEVICQVDQDVILARGWLAALLPALDDPAVAAAQGCYVTDAASGFLARVMGLDLTDRYAAIAGRDVDHVCTGNTAYRTDLLRAAGGFDETLGYGCDVDLSYRLGRSQRLVIRPEARAVHRWREGLLPYLRQQYGFGYGRLDLIAKHRHRFTGDDVGRPGMILHAAAMAVVLALVVAAAVLAIFGGPAPVVVGVAAIIVAVLALERTLAGIRALAREHDGAALGFPVIHLLRDGAWAVAIFVWTTRRILRRHRHPLDSMI